MDFSLKRTWGPVPKYDLVKNYEPPNKGFVFISGPCSVESSQHIFEMAEIVKGAGATHLRGGVFRAGTYPSDKHKFGWISEELIGAFHNAAKAHGLKNIIEVLDYSKESFELIEKYCDVFQVGARSSQNYSLLRKLGQYNKPVFLKRNTGMTVDELLGAAEHLLVGGVKELYLIERGSSTFHTDVRWTPCVHLIPSIKAICNIPVIIDASHSVGRRDLVEPVTLAGIAAGASGCLVECHTSPKDSLSDPDQAITPDQLYSLSNKITKLREALK